MTRASKTGGKKSKAKARNASPTCSQREMAMLPDTELYVGPADGARPDELPYRLRQQSLLGDFGKIAMQTRDLGQILQRATELCAQGLARPIRQSAGFWSVADLL